MDTNTAELLDWVISQIDEFDIRNGPADESDFEKGRSMGVGFACDAVVPALLDLKRAIALGMGPLEAIAAGVIDLDGEILGFGLVQQ